MRFVIHFLSFLLVTNFLVPGVFENPDRPDKGRWMFSPGKVWEVDSAGSEILVDSPCLRLDTQGNVFVMDSRRNKIHVFSPQGKYKFSFAKKGEGPGEIKEAYHFSLSKNKVMVPDGITIHYFSTNGKFLKSTKTTEMLIPYLFLDEDRLLAVPLSSVVLRDKTRQRDVFLYHLKTRQKKKLFDIPRVKALRYSSGGTRLILRMPDEIGEELAVALSPKGFYYGYSNAYTIFHMDFSGKELGAFTINGRKRYRINEQEKRIVLTKATQLHRDIPRNVVYKMADQVPDQLPYFHHLHADDNGFVYVLTSNISHPNTKHVDIFSAKGTYLYRGLLKLNDDYAIIQFVIRNTDLVAFIEDGEGERKLVKYTIKIPQPASLSQQNNNR